MRGVAAAGSASYALCAARWFAPGAPPLEIIRCDRGAGRMADVQDQQLIRLRRIEDEEWKMRRGHDPYIGTLS